MNVETKTSSSDKTAVRPFRVDVPAAELDDMRRRIKATRFPEKETVADFSQGVQLAFIQALARYWATEYDWRRCEAQLNAHPQFITEIDGLDIHFIHVRSRHEDAMPLIVTHGWPGSPIEQLKIIDPLTNPTAHGGSASDAFHVVIPSMPGYGFSGKPTTAGWDPARMARASVELMKRLGYKRFAAQGGDWGGFVTNLMAQQAPPELIGIHVNFSGAAPPDVSKTLQSGGPPPAGLSAEERRAYDQMAFLYQHVPTQLMMAAHPQTLYGLADSPVALAAWMIDHDVASYGHIVKLFVDGEPYGDLTRDDILDNITLSWLTNTSSPRAATLRRGNSRRSSRKNCARDSDRCARSRRMRPHRLRKEVLEGRRGNVGASALHLRQQRARKRRDRPDARVQAPSRSVDATSLGCS